MIFGENCLDNLFVIYSPNTDILRKIKNLKTKMRVTTRPWYIFWMRERGVWSSKFHDSDRSRPIAVIGADGTVLCYDFTTEGNG